MNKIKIFGIALLTMTMGLVSCGDDFLSVNPPTKISVEEFYDTEEDMLIALTAAYAPLQWEPYSWGWGGSTIISDIMGDDMRGGSTASDNPYIRYADLYTVNVSNMGDLGRWWTIGYSGAYRANQVLEYLPLAAENMSAASVTSMRAEAIFLRSYYYYNLWRFFGNVPYLAANPTYPYKPSPQLTSDEIYDLVVWSEDGLNSIIDDLPETRAGKDLGRVTKAAAQMLKARFVMLQNDTARYPEVLADMKKIIDGGKYALKTTVTDRYNAPVGNSPLMSYIPTAFEALYMQEGEFDKESILEFNYLDNGATQGWDSPTQAGGTILPTWISPREMTPNNDFRSGWCFAVIPEATYNIYDAADTRRDGGILNMEKWIADYAANENMWVDDPDTKNVVDPQPVEIEYNSSATYDQETGYFLKKYVARIGYNTRGTGTGSEDFAFKNNIRIFRYAEVLLNAAELAVLAGDTASAQKWLDMIRDRAYGDTDHRITATMESIKLERRKEFVGDGLRYWDLVRWNDAASVLGPNGWKSNVTINGVQRWLWPIPDSEVSKAASTEYPLEQNPGY